MELDLIYKSRIGDSHEAGLQAVYDLALAEAAKAFVTQQPPPEPIAVAPTPTPAPAPVVTK